MRQAEQSYVDWSGLRPSRVVLTLIGINVVAYVFELLAMRAGLIGLDGAPFALVPADVASGQVWQLVTSMLMHNPADPGHLIWNMVYLWIFGAQLEREAGDRTVLWSYLGGGLAGSLLQIALGALGLLIPSAGILDLWHGQVLGASGACMGVAFTWLARHYSDVLNMLFLGPVRGSTLMWGMFGIEVLRMLSFGVVAWGSHMGGMLMGMAFGFGWVRPTTWRGWAKRKQLERRGRQIEAQLKVLEGGKSSKGQKPQGRQRGDDWVN
jgi:membrane associated rhomboid family serine protease